MCVPRATETCGGDVFAKCRSRRITSPNSGRQSKAKQPLSSPTSHNHSTGRKRRPGFTEAPCRPPRPNPSQEPEQQRGLHHARPSQPSPRDGAGSSSNSPAVQARRPRGSRCVDEAAFEPAALAVALPVSATAPTVQESQRPPARHGGRRDDRSASSPAWRRRLPSGERPRIPRGQGGRARGRHQTCVELKWDCHISRLGRRSEASCRTSQLSSPGSGVCSHHDGRF